MPAEEIKAKLAKQTKKQIETVAKVAKKGIEEGKGYYKSVLLFTAFIFLANGLLLYFGTVFGHKIHIDVARIYGLKHGSQPHLQRTVGLLLIVTAILDILPLFIRSNALLYTSFGVNILVILHYIAETVYFWSLRIEVMVLLALVLGTNAFWSLRHWWYQNKIKKQQ